ncbi:MAG TPA: NAD-dependent epimerase/dehydratase family protein [Longimicrobiales bacterium]|nr:NAD-dependent epimerase/dehydratase family protein [Longimicrobiales bacterium]
MSETKVLVTGGAGFIGSHVAEAYLARGYRTWVVDDLSSGRAENVAPGIELIRMDIGDDALDALFRDVGGFDIVNHHAAQIDVRRSVADPRADARINVDGFLNVLECSRRHGTKRFIFVSSGGVLYGEADVLPTPETSPKQPLSPYGVTKLTAEHYLHAYAHVHGMAYVALRYGNVYGPRQDPHGEAGVVAIFSNRLLAGEPLTVYGDGEQTRDYVYVGDVVAANLAATDAALPPPGHLDDRAFNIGTGVGTSVNALADVLMEVADRRVPVRHAPERPGELRHSVLDARRAAQIGWTPRMTLREGLSRTFNHIAMKGTSPV